MLTTQALTKLICLHVSGLRLEAGRDTISVYDGPFYSDRLLGTVTSDGQNATFQSTGRSMTVRFRSDGSTTYKGFHAVYRSLGESL